MKRIAAVAIVLVLAAVAGAVGFVESGLYDVSATDQHLRATYHAIRRTMDRSIERRARDIEVPHLGGEEQLARGNALFRLHCVQCHGAPGVAPEPFALALRPLPNPLARSGREKPPAYLFWVVRHGIKMTAMPAWQFRLPEDDLWAVVAFVRQLPALSAEDYAKLPVPQLSIVDAPPEGPADADRGEAALQQYGCVACHEIPGMVGPEARLGPTLHGIGSRLMLGGVLPNSPENMAAWIREPQRFAPHTAMPNLGVSRRDARDMAARLATYR